MKTRNDFVSNSSSCSFIVHVIDEKTLEHLNKPSNKKVIDDYCSSIASSYDDIYSYDGALTYSKDMDLEIGDFLMINAGEDHDIHNIEKIENLYHELMDGFEDLTVYQDLNAHYSYGKKYKED